ncbi:hypothetical protein MGMO_27c00010 [Methyloglobulus morosus KoM1]|uniref:Uncharacterized protein n=1 Tax=Methyloglobulus morosus KoM1 TaxID=1116472 RepID=V5C927_9GAMM|nr:hypothetical protein [Methyloglobulus morosus]ESS73258.1 hypothetical protein MGMO_27c00010 [Methyloglobulus morosus KoM1]
MQANTTPIHRLPKLLDHVRDRLHAKHYSLQPGKAQCATLFFTPLAKKTSPRSSVAAKDTQQIKHQDISGVD